VVVELPGVAKGDLTIEAKENAIRIAGRKDLKYQEDASIHRRERIRGVFDRTIAIPIQIDPIVSRRIPRRRACALNTARGTAEAARDQDHLMSDGGNGSWQRTRSCKLQVQHKREVNVDPCRSIVAAPQARPPLSSFFK
jgi:Hsp20/alpha crystallin family